MLDKNNPTHNTLIEEFRAKIIVKSKQDPQGMKSYRKADETEDYFSPPIKSNCAEEEVNNTKKKDKGHVSTLNYEEVGWLKERKSIGVNWLM